MERHIDTSLDLCSYYFAEDLKIRILDNFLIVEAERKRGIKGVNLTVHKFKTCIKMRKNVDIDKIKAFFVHNMLRITTTGAEWANETEIIIDKRQARKPKHAPPKFDRKKQENYDRFMIALREIGMIGNEF